MKTSFGPKSIIYPLPVLLLGTFDKEGKPNIMTASWGGIVNSLPPMISIGVRKDRHTYQPLVENGEFSVSFPSCDLVREADYCGIYSGNKVDKIKDLGLHFEKSNLINAPIFDEFKSCILCKVIQRIELPTHDLFIAEILDFLADETVLTDGKVDIKKLDPFIYDNMSHGYYSLDKRIKDAYTEKQK